MEVLGSRYECHSYIYMKKLNFRVSDDILKLGVKVLIAQIVGGVNSKSNREFEVYLKDELEDVKKIWQGKDLKNDPVLQGFRDLHNKVGKSNRKYPASPEALLGLFLETGRFPRINTLVDIYNLVSIKTRLALGAHDISGIEGNVTLRLTDGSETFIPLGSNQIMPISAGEYCYVDDGNNVICRLEVLQVEQTKITLNSKNVFLIIQGNANTTNGYIEAGAKQVLDLIRKYCNGKYTFLSSF